MSVTGAQAVLLLLVLYAFTLPLLVAAFVNKLWLAILIDFISVQSYFALNEVARDLEDPFVYEPNDLPMARLQVSIAPDLDWIQRRCLTEFWDFCRESMRCLQQHMP